MSGKDAVEVAGVRTTFGSPIYADNVPAKSNLLVENLEANGGIVYAKSNTPEFGAGANTFNEVFGATLNPWNTTRSAAGSSGGAAVALATGTPVKFTGVGQYRQLVCRCQRIANAVAAFRFFDQDIEIDPLHPAGGANEAAIDDLIGQADRFEYLRTFI